MGCASQALPAGLVHRPRDRTPAKGGDTALERPDASCTAATADTTRDRAGSLSSADAGRRHRRGRRCRGACGDAGRPAPDEAVYLDSLRRRRDLAVLVLLDVSGSSAETGTFGQTVHEQQRAVATALTVALHELGDRVALYAYQSQGRSAVHMMPVKRFDDTLNALVMRRLGSLAPGAYSRLGAAIRHGASVISEKAGTSRRLLVVLSDGLAYDHGYERVYGAADARRALSEARRRGIGCLCLTIGAATDAGELGRVFGSTAHAIDTQAEAACRRHRSVVPRRAAHRGPASQDFMRPTVLNQTSVPR